jgi:uncharacterized protein DUF3880
MMRIAFLGNHEPEFSTERELDWTFEQLGHNVIRLQEGRASTDDCLNTARGSDAFLWVHTHSWQLGGSLSPEQMLEELRRLKIPSFAFHLDRYWGLDQLDKRETRVGSHAFWKCQYVFTADGGNQEKFAARGINHFWLPPAVAKRHCFIGNVRPEFTCDVAFVGARGYHPEYPFRTQLVSWLDQPHGWNVKRFGGDRAGYRGAPLNDIYASAKIVVGDSCFAGAPYYWSDRVPETLGRAGFLLHPYSLGMKMPIQTYEPQNVNDLGARIEAWLSNEKDREEIKRGCFDWVRTCDTYHNRVHEMLNVMGLE